MSTDLGPSFLSLMGKMEGSSSPSPGPFLYTRSSQTDAGLAAGLPVVGPTPVSGSVGGLSKEFPGKELGLAQRSTLRSIVFL